MSRKLIFSLVVVMAAVFAVGIGQSHALSQLAPGGIGDLLLGPVYDVRTFEDNPVLVERQGLGTWENFIEIQNTTNKWVAAHLRFRTYEKSVEVWDHIILLSPYDVFWLYITKPVGTPGVRLASSDWATLGNSGLISQADAAAKQWVLNNPTGITFEWSQFFSTDLMIQNGYEGKDAELEYGEIEIIGVWSIDNKGHAISAVATNSYADPNDPLSVNVYDILYTAWGSLAGPQPPTYPWVGAAADGLLEDCGNVLKGSVELGDTLTGQYNLYNFVGIADFRTDFFLHRDQVQSGAIVYPVASLLVGADRCYGGPGIAYYLNADWATTAGPTLRDGDALIDDLIGFNGAWSLPDVEAALFKSELWTFYLTGDTFTNGMPLSTDITLTFPTKYLHYFVVDLNPASAFPYWQDGFAFCGNYSYAVQVWRAKVKGMWDKLLNGPIKTVGGIYNVDQDTFGFSPGPSPYAYLGPYVPHEVNIIRVGEVDTIFEIPADKVDNFPMGQISLTDWYFLLPWDKTEVGNRPLPVIGISTRIHNVGGTAVYRSVSAPLEWTIKLQN